MTTIYDTGNVDLTLYDGELVVKTMDNNEIKKADMS